MIVLIPMATGVELRPEVQASIMDQTIRDIVIFEGRHPGVKNSQRVYTQERWDGEVASRNICRQYAMKSSGDLFIMQDPDIKHRKRDNFERMVEMLINDTALGVVTLWKDYGCARTDSKHLPISCMIVRRRVLELVEFRYDGECTCNTFRKDVEKAGFDFKCMDDTYAAEELK